MPFKKVYPRCVCFLLLYSNSIYKEILISEEVSNFRNVEALFLKVLCRHLKQGFAKMQFHDSIRSL
jgi:hypothetical protein